MVSIIAMTYKMKLLLLVVLIAFFGSSQGKSLLKPITFLDYNKNHDLSTRIINGELAQEKQIPWQVSLYLDDGSSAFLCGGSLIHKEWVLTAAHCVRGMKNFKMHFGNLHKFQGDQIKESHEAYAHENYDPSLLVNDIALIRIPSPGIVENDLVKVIPLPLRSEINDNLANKEVLISGWGATDDAGGNTDYLKFAHVDVITPEKCKEYFGQYAANSTLCAVGKNKESTCFGDSGGPLAYQKNGIWTHAAVVSFVSGGGCAKGYPSGYVRTVHFIDWISKKTGVNFP